MLRTRFAVLILPVTTTELILRIGRCRDLAFPKLGVKLGVVFANMLNAGSAEIPQGAGAHNGNPDGLGNILSDFVTMSFAITSRSSLSRTFDRSILSAFEAIR